MSDIHKHLELAEEQLSLALAKLLQVADGTGQRSPSGKLWVGVWGEVRKTASAMLKVKQLAAKIRHCETPRERRP